MGYGYGWVAPTLRKQQDVNAEFALDNDQCSWIGSLHELGRIFGPFLALFLVDTVGRQKVLVFCTLTFFAIWPVIIFTRSVAVLYAIRFIFGVAIGINDVCSSIYVCENCNANLRGILGSISIASFYVGELAEFAIATFLPYQTVAIVNTILTFLALSSILVNTETAQYLIMKKNLEKAEKNFNWLRGKEENDGEFQKLKLFVEDENAEKISFKDLFVNRIYYKPILLILVLCILMMMTGFSAVTSFVSIAFAESEMLTPNQFTTLFGFCQLVTVCLSPFFIEKFNRRTILLTSFGAIAVIHAVTAAFYYVISRGFAVPYSSWFIFGTITVYAMVFSFGLHPIFYTVRGEMFPQNIKVIGGCIGVVGHSLMGFFSAKLFLMVADTFGIYVNFLIFGFCGAAAVLIVYRWIPETRGKTLAEIQDELRRKLN